METKTDNIINVTLLEPKLKHSTIFARFDELVEGESIIIHNDHDPIPLYYQLLGERGEIFSWEYLEQGPDWWKVKISKHKTDGNEDDSGHTDQSYDILNVTLLEPKLKHPTIFARFDELVEGESIIIHNDHDPIPLYYQLLGERGEIFSWEYLEQGPDWWKVKISKHKTDGNEDDSGHTDQSYDILNVTLLEPKLKHPTIFARFDDLDEGESFTILNDHDPAPLYYQLLGERGKIFSWEYLEQGPDWWKVRILKLKTNGKSEASQRSDQSYNILNVTLLEPKLKHPTIFAHFDDLEEGESFTILNDHDPKPLYYQLLGERGEIFSWEYLEQGPAWWKVKIGKNVLGGGEETLGEIAAKDFRKAKVFKKFGLDFCCRGNRTVREACSEKGLDVKIVEQELFQAESAQDKRPLPYNDWNLDFLADYIVNTHHAYLRKNLPDIRHYADKVMRSHGNNYPELLKVQQLVELLNAELTAHIEKEEQVLFPQIKQLVLVKNNPQAANNNATKTIKNSIKVVEMEHDSVGKYLTDLSNVTDDYNLPDGACASYDFLYKILQEFEDDVLLHIHLENNILFPKAMELEDNLKVN